MIEKVLEQYNFEGKLVNLETNDVGNINSTYVATFEHEDGTRRRYLIQKINTTVFTEPYKLMKNIEGVTTYLKKELIKNNDTDHKVLELIKTKDGKPLCFVDDGGDRDYYRIYDFIEDAVTYSCSTDSEIVRNTGKAFGNFQKQLRN